MKKIFILLFILCLTINFVYSADWYYNQEKGFFIDKSSILKTKNSIQAWIIFMGHGKIGNKKYDYFKEYVDVKCSDKTMATLEVIFYTIKGKAVESVNTEKDNHVEYTRIVPNTRGEALFNDICGMK